MKTPDILNSKIKKIRIELPNYSFSHSSSGDSSHTFVGRERIREKLKQVVEDSPAEPGVYLVAGNRGVGKTSLVNWVIEKTSLQLKSKFTENLKYLIILLLAVAGTQFCLKKFYIPKTYLPIIFFLILALSFYLLCCFNSYSRKFLKSNWKEYIKDSIKSAVKELSYLINPYNPHRKTQYVLKIILVVCYTQICFSYSGVTPTQAFVFYLCFVFACMFRRFIKGKLHEYYQKHKKDKLSKKTIYNIENKGWIWVIDALIISSSLMLLFLPLWKNFISHFNLGKLLIILVPFIMVFILVCVWCCVYLEKSIVNIIRIIFYETILNPINNYIKNHNRLYLRINFGHKLKDDKDILRLIARTLSTEYHKYRHSFWQILPWRATALGFLLLFAYLFSGIVKGQKFYDITKQIVEDKKFYEVINNKDSLKNVFFTVDTVYIKAKTEAGTTVKTKVGTKIGTKVGVLLSALDTLVSEISKETRIGKFFYSLGYLFWLSFFSIYLFCALLFRCTLVTHFFVTHRIIIRRLKKLNSDITHSTERENSVHINESIGTGIGTRTKKSRNIADAKEIEKELQDILSYMQRIPSFMCRPNIVIVFDELDKVEPGDTSLENENPQTKASMFSIDATRERQTEILKILSNMKYFLSTASAKFIFIAGREMFDIHLADVSERNNYIGSIFNVVIHVPSFLTDHHTGKKSIPEESSIVALPEEFVCRRLIPHEYPVESYDLRSYEVYLKNMIYKNVKDKEQKIQKIIAILQQFIIYLAHLSKGAPKKMMQLFESFVEIRNERDSTHKRENTLVVRRYRGSRHFLSFNYYKQYTLGIIAYLITPIFYRLSESNIKEHSDKLLVSSLRFIDFLFKFHKHSFSWRQLDISPEMLEVNHAPELKSVAVDLVNYLAQIHINKSNFSLSEYKFDGLIANEIFAMTKTDEVFSALFSFSLDETSPLKKHYQDLLERTEKKYSNDKNSAIFIDAISSLQVVLGDLHYYDDQLEEAEAYYKSAVQALRKLEQKNYDKAEKDDEKMTLERLYVYVRNMLRLGMIYEKRKQYDFAYLTYGELCKRIIRERDIEIDELNAGIVLRRIYDYEKSKDSVVFVKTSVIGRVDEKEKKYNDNIEVPQIRFLKKILGTVHPSKASPQPLYFGKISPNTNDMLFKKMTFEGLKMLYLPFIAKLQILEKSHIGGITRNHLIQLDKEFEFLTSVIHHEEAKLLEAEFFSRVADILYYKNSDLNDLRCKKDKNKEKDTKNSSCTACYYYHKALSILLGKTDFDRPENKDKNTVIELLSASIDQIKNNYNMKFCTILARILSDWGNVFFSCDINIKKNGYNSEENKCYICDRKDCNTISKNNSNVFLNNCIKYLESERENSLEIKLLETKKDIAFAMYSISLHAYRKANLYKRSAYQIYKMLCLFKHYKIYDKDYIDELSEKAINYLWYATENLNVFELNKRKKDFGKFKEKIPLENLLVDSEITRIRILVKELELKLNKMKTSEDLRKYYDMRVTSPYKINYSIVGRIYRLRLKSNVNYEAYRMLTLELTGLITKYKDGSGDKSVKPQLDALGVSYDKDKVKVISSEINYILNYKNCNETAKIIFGKYFDIYKVEDVTIKKKIKIFENLIAETIYCLIDIVQLSETMDETYLFSHSFLGSIHKHLSFWIRLYEAYEKYRKEKSEIDKYSRIGAYLEKYLGEEWREQLSGYSENQKALAHYYKCLEMHNEGKAYHNMIDTMCYLKDDYNDRSDHFNIAEERHFILNKDFETKIYDLKKLYEDSKLYKVDNYFHEVSPQTNTEI
jgi:transcription termination factor NusB